MEQLLLEIAHCENLVNKELDNPCKKIIECQTDLTRQLPEPWNGHLNSCKLLFISSNPSINPEEYFPRTGWDDQNIIDFFLYRFDFEHEFVKKYLYPKLEGEYSTKWVRYWGFVRSVARQLLQYEPVAGVDYAMTEVVHCKSLHEKGVAEAMEECKRRYLNRIVAISQAKIIIAIGDNAREIINVEYALVHNTDEISYIKIGNNQIAFISLPHSNARKKRSLTNVLSQQTIAELQEILRRT